MAYRDRLATHLAPELHRGENVVAVARGAQGGWALFMTVGAVIGFTAGWAVGSLIDAREIVAAIGVATGIMVGTMWWARQVSELAVPPFFALAATSTGRLLVVERDPILGRARTVAVTQEAGETTLRSTRRGWIDRRATLTVDRESFDLRFPVGQDIAGVVAALSR